MLADDRRLADNDTCTVIDEEMLADRRTRMDIDTGNAVRILGHHTGDHGHTQKMQFMRDAIDRNGK